MVVLWTFETVNLNIPCLSVCLIGAKFKGGLTVLHELFVSNIFIHVPVERRLMVFQRLWGNLK